MAPPGSGRKEELLAPSAVSVSSFILIFTPPNLSELFSQLWCPNSCDFLFLLFGFGFVLQCWAWNPGLQECQESILSLSYSQFLLLSYFFEPYWVIQFGLASTSKVADKFQLPIKHTIVETMEMVQPIKYLLCRHEDLTVNLQHPSETQAYTVLYTVVLVLEKQRQENLWACCPASLDKSMSSKFGERLSQKMR